MSALGGAYFTLSAAATVLAAAMQNGTTGPVLLRSVLLHKQATFLRNPADGLSCYPPNIFLGEFYKKIR